MSQLNSSQ